jgi:quercetin dioxygenase-like cupin family protein
VKHWHGATAKTSVIHIAITSGVNGANVVWLEKVTDEQYAR